jgi:LysM repeat protein
MVWKSRISQRVLLIVSLLTVGSLLPLFNVQAQQGGTNLLVNGDFEWWDPTTNVWPFQDGIPEVQVCPGWHAFYLDNPPAYAELPQYWRRPEFRDVKGGGEFPTRVHGGFRAAKYFSFAGQHEAGFYQQVSGIAPETPLRFSAYMQTWSCMPEAEWNVCPTGDKSNNPATMHTRIGIDPTGGTNPWSPNIVWSPEIDAYDVWTYFQVEATAQNSTVTVFTYSRPDWTDELFRINNDVYLDDASLVTLNEALPTDTPEPEAPTATLDPSLPTSTPAPTATPAATATPRPDGAIVHIVQDGDTLGAIALRYAVSVETLLQLNGLSDANMLSVGQELVIAVPESPAAATPVPALPLPTAVLPTPTAGSPTSAGLIPVPTAIPPATALPMPASATIPAATVPTQETQKKTTPWGFVGGIGVALILGAGIGFVFGKRR